ncbi:ABC transporter permease [Paractinoplanes rishiriensis]|uniref:ABC transporter permease n=1 Tax=Paractinoplanes rishiriensis TaxID=1050105 RepID=A0A919K041_9ACTN|nr:ABC transporter permease [Actinoplanes rishiriensis]GIE94166.1 ABC transporter permease [Actinoplanes rishiriensis]
MTATLERSSLHAGDLLRVGSIGLRTRRTRAVLSALGIAIGIAAMVSVLGVSDSSKADLLASLDRLGTNLLTVQAGGGIGGGETTLPATAEQMLARIGPVERVASVTPVDGTVRRTDLVPSTHTGGLTVQAADPALLDTLAAELATGAWLDSTRSALPVTVLGAVAAERLGVTTGAKVWVADQWFSVIGVLRPVELAQDLDRSVLIGRDLAISALGADEAPGTVYLRTMPNSVDAVRGVVAATANPRDPDQVTVSRPSDAIAAKAAASSAFTNLFLALGAVALLVGGVGIANVMVISVLERRSEIGLRRALGATRRHISAQFLAEAVLLSAIGGLGGALLGTAITAVYDLLRGWPLLVPTTGIAGGFAAAVLIGAVAGLYPAVRASRLSPTEALRTV